MVGLPLPRASTKSVGSCPDSAVRGRKCPGKLSAILRGTVGLTGDRLELISQLEERFAARGVRGGHHDSQDHGRFRTHGLT